MKRDYQLKPLCFEGRSYIVDDIFGLCEPGTKTDLVLVKRVNVSSDISAIFQNTILTLVLGTRAAERTLFLTRTATRQIQSTTYLERRAADVVVDDSGHIGELELGLAERLLDKRIRDTNRLFYSFPRLNLIP